MVVCWFEEKKVEELSSMCTTLKERDYKLKIFSLHSLC